MIKLEKISKKYIAKNKQVTAVNNIDILINKGSITGIIGESGAGKSTIIDLIAGIAKPDSGYIYIDNIKINDLSKLDLINYRRKLGVVFQEYNLLENLTVIDNIVMPLKLKGINKNEQEEKALLVLDFVGLENEQLSYPSQLSGGQRQRVAIARAIINKPEILLLDEITSALDQESANTIIELLKKINKEFDITILLVSHDLLTVKKLCSEVYIIKNGSLVDNFKLSQSLKTSNEFNYREILLGDQNV